MQIKFFNDAFAFLQETLRRNVSFTRHHTRNVDFSEQFASIHKGTSSES